MSKPGLLTLTIKDKSALYLAYMPFVVNGGLFIPTNSSYRLGDEVFMLLNLMGEEEKIPVAGTVIWMCRLPLLLHPSSAWPQAAGSGHTSCTPMPSLWPASRAISSREHSLMKPPPTIANGSSIRQAWS